MRSLWLKLVGAFALVILTSAVVNSLLINGTTSGQFNRYVTQSGQAWAERLAPELAGHYARAGSWAGVEDLLSGRRMGTAAMGGAMGPGMMGSGGMGRGTAWNDQGAAMGLRGPGTMGGDMWAMMGLRLLLADEAGRVIADSASGATGMRLAPADLEAGTPVVVESRQVGTLLAVAAAAGEPLAVSNFVSSANRATWLVSLGAGMLALALGVILFRQIVAPVQAVTTAAQRMAAGELDQRVPVTSQDEIGQMGRAFNQMADALSRDQQLRQNMIADIAHELGTPLSVLQSHLEAMLDGVLPASPQEIASLHDETAHLSRLVADLRLLSVAEAGQLRLQRAEVELGNLIESVIERMQLHALENDVEIATEIAPDLPRVEVDASRISQTLGNLLSNALRHTPAGGRVTVRAFRQTEPDGQPVAVVKVADTGSGIAAEDLAHVFDRFYRADKSRSKHSGGAGIGLAIVKQLIEAHGGRVWVESQAGQGAKFIFTVPAS